MPISLMRLHRIIEAARIYLDRDHTLRSRITSIAARGGTAADIINYLSTIPEYHPAEAVIREEATRYQLTFRRSIAERERLQRRRAGIPPSPKKRSRTRYGGEGGGEAAQYEIAPTADTGEYFPDAISQMQADMQAEDETVDAWITETDQPTVLPEELPLTPTQQREYDKYMEEKRRKAQGTTTTTPEEPEAA